MTDAPAIWTIQLSERERAEAAMWAAGNAYTYVQHNTWRKLSEHEQEELAFWRAFAQKFDRVREVAT